MPEGVGAGVAEPSFVGSGVDVAVAEVVVVGTTPFMGSDFGCAEESQEGIAPSERKNRTSETLLR